MRHGNDARIYHAQDFLLVGIPQNRQPSDLSPILQRAILLEAFNAKQAASLLLRHAEVACNTDAADCRQVRDSPALESGLHLGVLFHPLVSGFVLLVKKIGLHAFHFGPREESLGIHVHKRLEGLRGLFDHNKRFPSHGLTRLPDQDFCFRWFLQLNQGVARLGIHLPRGLQNLVSGPNFLRSKPIQWMRRSLRSRRTRDRHKQSKRKDVYKRPGFQWAHMYKEFILYGHGKYLSLAKSSWDFHFDRPDRLPHTPEALPSPPN